MVFCSCGGPGRVETDWRGDSYVVCDALTPCEMTLGAQTEASAWEDFHTVTTALKANHTVAPIDRKVAKRALRQSFYALSRQHQESY